MCIWNIAWYQFIWHIVFKYYNLTQLRYTITIIGHDESNILATSTEFNPLIALFTEKVD